MENTKETNNPINSYEQIAAIFSKDATSLLPEERIRQTLTEERQRFDNISAMQISPLGLIGVNTERHCKDLLRRNQPLFPLYLFLSFLMESSMIMLIIMGILWLLEAGLQYFSLPEITSLIPASYIIIAVTGFTLYQYISREIWYRQLAQDASPEKLLKNIRRQKYVAGIVILLLCAITATAVYISEISRYLQINILGIFIFYVATASLSCLHNLIYDSHMISFLSVGIEILNPRRNRRTETASRYIDANLQQITKQALRSRLVSFRIYADFGIIIFIALDAVCLYHLLPTFSISLLMFFLLVLFCTLVCLIVLLSSRSILKLLTSDTPLDTK